jgi:arginyl-tRNA synthetase
MLLCQLVKLYRGGEPVRMSKRAGEFVTLRDVVDEVGRDPIRFMMLYRKNDAPLDFDFAKVTEQSKDNPVFYVQYASARSHSVFRQAREQLGVSEFPRAAMEAAADRLADEGEIGEALIILSNWPPAHGFPLNALGVTLRDQTLGVDDVVANPVDGATHRVGDDGF